MNIVHGDQQWPARCRDSKQVQDRGMELLSLYGGPRTQAEGHLNGSASRGFQQGSVDEEGAQEPPEAGEPIRGSELDTGRADHRQSGLFREPPRFRQESGLPHPRMADHDETAAESAD
ncbi:hypothetical protein ASC58_09910 [Phycicoccus sp. Root101]|nr:hypothetical protein ASC58_09910 [Phycicoccus sp. Root101]